VCFSVASSAKEYASVSVRLKSGKRQQFFFLLEYLLNIYGTVFLYLGNFRKWSFIILSSKGVNCVNTCSEANNTWCVFDAF